MSRMLGVEASAGTAILALNDGAVLYISPDGKELKTRMRKDADDEDEPRRRFSRQRQ